MYKIEISANPERPALKYTYLVGAYTVGIITPSRKRHLFPIHEVTGRPFGSRIGENNGLADSRLHPDEVAAFVLKHGLK